MEINVPIKESETSVFTKLRVSNFWFFLKILIPCELTVVPIRLRLFSRGNVAKTSIDLFVTAVFRKSNFTIFSWIVFKSWMRLSVIKSDSETALASSRKDPTPHGLISNLDCLETIARVSTSTGLTPLAN